MEFGEGASHGSPRRSRRTTCARARRVRGRAADEKELRKMWNSEFLERGATRILVIRYGYIVYGSLTFLSGETEDDRLLEMQKLFPPIEDSASGNNNQSTTTPETIVRPDPRKSR